MRKKDEFIIPFENMTIEEEIGSGSYGTVYRVTKEGKNLAMKVIRVSRDEKEQGTRLTETEREAESRRDLQQISEDILKEIRALEKLQGNKNIVSVLDYRIVEETGGIDFYILMEYLQPFAEYESVHGMKEADVIRMGIDLCSALEACEELDILHRDLKPDNILVTEDGVFKICDFGTAKILEKTHTENSVKGTFTYMAPEVYHGKKYNSRADLYSLGMILYRTMNRGREPFIPGDRRMIYYKDKEEALNRRMNGEALPPPIDASEEFAEILARTCAFYPEKRYRSAADLKKDLILLQNGKYRKKQKAEKYGKRDKVFYLKTVVIGLLAAILLGAAGKAARYRYLEYFVNYCDTDMQKEMMEKYDLDLSARLTGNGILYINSNDDLYCYTVKKLYPWMNQKDKIREIIFGEAVSELDCTGYAADASDYSEQNYEQKYQEYARPFYSADETFRNCRNLEKIIIKGKRLVIHGSWIFEGDENLRAFECAEDADIVMSSDRDIFQGIPWYKQQEVCILGDRLVKYQRPEEVVHLPDNIHKIGEGAFENNSNVKTVILPDRLEYIGLFAFAGCSSLESLVIPETVTEIVNVVFNGCSNLKELDVLPGNPSFKMVEGSLYDTEQNILKWCSPGTGDTVAIQEGTVAADPRACEECNAKKLVIPDSMTGEISYLGRMKNLEEVSVSDANKAYTLTDDILYYNGNWKYAVACLKNRAGHVQVEEGTKILSEYCFASCKEVTSVTLPDTVESIMGYAFENCSGLQSITIPASVTLMTTHVFDGCDSLTEIYYGGTEEEWRELADHYGAGVDEERVTVHFG